MSQKPLLPDWIPLGHVAKAHGVHGAVQVVLSHPQSDSLRPGINVCLCHPGLDPGSMDPGLKAGVTAVIQDILSNNRVHFKGVHTRTEAEKLAKTQLWVRRADLPQLEKDEIYLADLLGFEAVNLEGQSLGQVTAFSDNGPQTLVELNHRELVPFVKPIWVRIEEESRKIVLDWESAVSSRA